MLSTQQNLDLPSNYDLQLHNLWCIWYVKGTIFLPWFINPEFGMQIERVKYGQLYFKPQKK